jgi:hypothetical protein
MIKINFIEIWNLSLQINTADNTWNLLQTVAKLQNSNMHPYNQTTIHATQKAQNLHTSQQNITSSRKTRIYTLNMPYKPKTLCGKP